MRFFASSNILLVLIAATATPISATPVSSDSRSSQNKRGDPTTSCNGHWDDCVVPRDLPRTQVLHQRRDFNRPADLEERGVPVAWEHSSFDPLGSHGHDYRHEKRVIQFPTVARMAVLSKKRPGENPSGATPGVAPGETPGAMPLAVKKPKSYKHIYGGGAAIVLLGVGGTLGYLGAVSRGGTSREDTSDVLT